MNQHVCDPNGEPCPPWAHPYPSTDEILQRQKRAAAERLQMQPPPAPRVRARPLAGTVTRLVTQWLRTLADLQRRGCVLTDQQREALAEILDHHRERVSDEHN